MKDPFQAFGTSSTKVQATPPVAVALGVATGSNERRPGNLKALASAEAIWDETSPKADKCRSVAESGAPAGS